MRAACRLVSVTTSRMMRSLAAAAECCRDEDHSHIPACQFVGHIPSAVVEAVRSGSSRPIPKPKVAGSSPAGTAMISNELVKRDSGLSLFCLALHCAACARGK